jgi:hypothetical protein
LENACTGHDACTGYVLDLNATLYFAGVAAGRPRYAGLIGEVAKLRHALAVAELSDGMQAGFGVGKVSLMVPDGCR